MNPEPNNVEDDIIFLEGDAKDFTPRPLEGIALQKALEELERIRKLGSAAIRRDREATRAHPARA
jgi:hypothetical protein